MHEITQCFDHDLFSRDDPLGWFEIPLTQIPRDQTVERFFKSARLLIVRLNDLTFMSRLQGVKTGEVHMSIRRAPLTSPEIRKVFLVRVLPSNAEVHSLLAQELIKGGKPLTKKALDKRNGQH